MAVGFESGFEADFQAGFGFGQADGFFLGGDGAGFVAFHELNASDGFEDVGVFSFLEIVGEGGGFSGDFEELWRQGFGGDDAPGEAVVEHVVLWILSGEISGQFFGRGGVLFLQAEVELAEHQGRHVVVFAEFAAVSENLLGVIPLFLFERFVEIGFETLEFGSIFTFALVFFGGEFDVKTAGKDFVEKSFLEAEGAADPGDLAVFDDESVRNAFEVGGFHPSLIHDASRAFAGVVEGDAVGHFLAHLAQGFHRIGWFVFADGNADDRDAIFIFEVKIIEMRDADLARTAPRSPEFDNVNFALFERFDGFALQPFGDFDGRGGVADS